MKKNSSEIIIYQTEDGVTKVNVRLDDDSVWLTQNDLVALKMPAGMPAFRFEIPYIGR